MSVLDKIYLAVKDTIRLADEVHSSGEKLKEISLELRDHDRRITRLEAQWQTALALSRKRLE
jgi:hypothetical protein